jgi:enoyl-CoA hydratase/carnithine racemase
MIVLACDRAVIAEDTYFSMPEINIGIPPLVPFELLAELLGMARAKDLVLTGKRVLPETCVALGLMTTAVPSTAVRSSAESLAAELCAKPAPSFRNFKLHVGRRMETIIDRTIGCGTREDAGSSRQRERGET